MKKGRVAQMLGRSNEVVPVSERSVDDIVPSGRMLTGMGVSTQNSRLEAKVDALQRALTQAKEASAAVFIPLDLIDANPWQPRRLFKEEPLRELCESIKTTNGVMQPIAVRKHPTDESRYQLIAGERRTRACRILELGTISAVVLRMTDADMASLALAENMVREDLADYEIGLALNRMQNEFPSKIALAESFGISRAHLYRYLSFVKLPAFVQNIIEIQPALLSARYSAELQKFIEENTIQADDPSLVQAMDELAAHKVAGADLVHRLTQLRAIGPRSTRTRVSKAVLFDGKKIGVITKDQKIFSFRVKASMLSPEQESQFGALIQKFFTLA